MEIPMILCRVILNSMRNTEVSTWNGDTNTFVFGAVHNVSLHTKTHKSQSIDSEITHSLWRLLGEKYSKIVLGDDMRKNVLPVPGLWTRDPMNAHWVTRNFLKNMQTRHKIHSCPGQCINLASFSEHTRSDWLTQKLHALFGDRWGETNSKTILKYDTRYMYFECEVHKLEIPWIRARWFITPTVSTWNGNTNTFASSLRVAHNVSFHSKNIPDHIDWFRNCTLLQRNTFQNDSRTWYARGLWTGDPINAHQVVHNALKNMGVSAWTGGTDQIYIRSCCPQKVSLRSKNVPDTVQLSDSHISHSFWRLLKRNTFYKDSRAWYSSNILQVRGLWTAYPRNAR